MAPVGGTVAQQLSPTADQLTTIYIIGKLLGAERPKIEERKSWAVWMRGVRNSVLEHHDEANTLHWHCIIAGMAVAILILWNLPCKSYGHRATVHPQTTNSVNVTIVIKIVLYPFKVLDAWHIDEPCHDTCSRRQKWRWRQNHQRSTQPTPRP